MAKQDDYYLAEVKKPITIHRGVVGFTPVAIRFGSLRADGAKWEYETPYAEITELSHQGVRGNVRGKLKDGSELSFRIQNQLNPMKDARAIKAMEVVLSRIHQDGGSVKRLGDDNAVESTAASGCGCVLPVALVMLLAVGVLLAMLG